MLQIVMFPSLVATVSLGAMGAMLSVTGIRLALGARRQEVLQAALARTFKLLACGSAAGLVLGILASRVLASIVHHATPRDPMVLSGVVLTILLLGLVATWILAQCALSLDPLNLLREERRVWRRIAFNSAPAKEILIFPLFPIAS